jgi:hypothetical protein
MAADMIFNKVGFTRLTLSCGGGISRRGSVRIFPLKDTPLLDSVLSVWLLAISIHAVFVQLPLEPLIFFGAIGRLEAGLEDVLRFEERSDVEDPCPSSQFLTSYLYPWCERSSLASFGAVVDWTDSVSELELVL